MRVCECSPAPSVGFRKPSGTLPVGRHKLSKHNTELLIENVQPSDEGQYLCKASNKVGDADEIINIEVHGRPILCP